MPRRMAIFRGAPVVRRGSSRISLQRSATLVRRAGLGWLLGLLANAANADPAAADMRLTLHIPAQELAPGAGSIQPRHGRRRAGRQPVEPGPPLPRRGWRIHRRRCLAPFARRHRVDGALCPRRRVHLASGAGGRSAGADGQTRAGRCRGQPQLRDGGASGDRAQAVPLAADTAGQLSRGVAGVGRARRRGAAQPVGHFDRRCTAR